MKVYTCTPKNFPADEDSFFSRESGLFCRALQSLGFDSKSVLLLPKYPLDGLGVLRGTYQELCDPVWWRALQLDGLILYSWAAPQYNAVAMAVHQAGIPAVIYMDTCGLVSRLGNRKGWWRHAWRPSWAKSGNIALRIYSLTKFFIGKVALPIGEDVLVPLVTEVVINADDDAVGRALGWEEGGGKDVILGIVAAELVTNEPGEKKILADGIR